MGQQVFVQNNGSATWNLNGKCESAEIPVLIINPQGGKSAAVQTVLDNVPADYDGLPLSKVRFESYDSDGNIEMVAVYESNGSGSSSSDSEAETEEEAKVSFTCGTSSIHLTEAISQVCKAGRLDAGNTIGWNGETGDNFRVDGVDAPFPTCHEVYTKKIKLKKLTTAYRRNVWKCVGKINKNTFKGWKKGEAMLSSVSFSAPDQTETSSEQDEVEVTFDFEIKLNESGYKYGGVTLAKEGFEYVWGMQKTDYDKDTKKPKLTVSGVYVAKVIPYADFSILGI